MTSSSAFNARHFFTNYDGHPIHHLSALLSHLCRTTRKPRIYLTGDSTLDNKFWLPSHTSPSPVSHLASIAHGSYHKRDVAHYMNLSSNRYITVNCAVEATTLAQRRKKLLEHDILVRDNITKDDVVVVSVGGNDIALAPSLCTILAVFTLVHFNLSFSMRHLSHLFGTQIEGYVQKLISVTKPRLVVVCMVYYPDQNRTPSWASFLLRCLCYSSRPEKLQRAISRVYEQVVSKIKIPNVKLITCPLYEVLDGKCANDYVERVEPSEQGGQKMAGFLMQYIRKAVQPSKA